MTKEELQHLYLDYLKEEGFKASVDEEGDIEFKFEGDKYILFVEEKDLEYFRIQSGYGFEFKTDEDKIKSLQVLNSVNYEYKLGKICVDIDEELVIVETGFFLVKPDDFKLFFKRCLGIIQGMISDFSDRVNEEEQSEE